VLFQRVQLREEAGACLEAAQRLLPMLDPDVGAALARR
jgi:hypothetical protein